MVDRRLILIVSLALIVVSVGLLLMPQKSQETGLLKAPPAAQEILKETITATAKPTAAPSFVAAKTHGDYFLLTENEVLEITKDKKILRTFPFSSWTAQRLPSGLTLFAKGESVFEADEEGNILWEYKDETMNATSAWRRDDGVTVVADANGRILKITPEREINKVLTFEEGSRPSSAFPLKGDDVLVADAGLNLVRWAELDKDGFVVWQYGTKGKTGFNFNYLNAPVFAADFQGQSALIADPGNNRLLEVAYSSSQPVWEVNFVPSAQSLYRLERTRLSASNRGVELYYQNRTFDWSYAQQPVFRALPVQNLPEPLAKISSTASQVPTGVTGLVTFFQEGLLRWFEGS